MSINDDSTLPETGKSERVLPLSYRDVDLGRIFRIPESEIGKLDESFLRLCCSCAILRENDYSLLRWNLKKQEKSFLGGSLISDSNTGCDYDKQIAQYIHSYVHPNDKSELLSLFNSENILAMLGRGVKLQTFEYRLYMDTENRNWINVTTDTVCGDGDDDVIQYMLLRNTDTKASVGTVFIENSENDPLTGLYSRRGFVRQIDQLLASSGHDTHHAFLVVDLDNFKLVNSQCGFKAGDNLILDIGQSISSVLRHGDIVGRTGGDEYIICLKNIPFNAVAERRAAQINTLMRRSLDNGLSVSGSIGIAFYPDDGESYDDIYKKAEAAMLTAKQSGRDRYMLYSPADKDSAATEDAGDTGSSTAESKNASVFIIYGCDTTVHQSALERLLNGKYLITGSCSRSVPFESRMSAAGGLHAVLYVVGDDAVADYQCLGRIKNNDAYLYVPVIVISFNNDVTFELNAYEAGASFYIQAPENPDIMNLRLKNALDKGERDRLRAQNNYLMMRQSEAAKYRTIIRSTSTVVIEYSVSADIFEYDSAITRYLSGTYDSRPLWQIFAGDNIASASDIKTMKAHFEKLKEDKKHDSDQLRVSLRTASGDMRWYRMSLFKWVDEYQIVERIYITFNDIHEQILNEKRLITLSERDSLTGVYNRSMFLYRTEVLLKSAAASQYTMAYIDINNFKAVNSLYGHERGNALLKRMAKKLSTAIGDSGICGRASADIFLVLVDRLEDHKAELLHAIETAISDEAIPCDISYCVGLYVIEDVTLPIENILDCATIAHDTVKGNYNQRIAYYDTNLHEEHKRAEEIVLSMESALKAGQFVPYYQPIYDYRTGKLDTAETLVRWNHPKYGLMLPREFVPLFEQNGFIVNLDQYIWECAFDFMRRRLDMNANVIPLSLNLSRVNFYNSELTCFIKSLYMKYMIPTHLIRFEITESAYVQSRAQLISVISELRQIGVMFELDDFGSGYSSLQTLTEVPFSTLKIDMGLINEASEKRQKESVLAHVIDLALSLDLDIVAEGVETVDQAEMLASLGCTKLQGFYYSAPSPEARFITMLKANQSM